MNQLTVLWIGSLWLCLTAVVVGGCRKNTPPPQSEAEGPEVRWLTDFDAAVETARQQGKDVFINFSGSDWCYWCRRLEKEVFSKDAFWQQAADQFVFVLIDFPNDKSGQSAALQKQNEKLSQQFGVQGFPTIILADATGEPYARTGYVEGGHERYLEHLKELRTQKTLP
jgi:thioredoxin-related protein